MHAAATSPYSADSINSRTEEDFERLQPRFAEWAVARRLGVPTLGKRLMAAVRAAPSPRSRAWAGWHHLTRGLARAPFGPPHSPSSAAQACSHLALLSRVCATCRRGRARGPKRSRFEAISRCARRAACLRTYRERARPCARQVACAVRCAEAGPPPAGSCRCADDTCVCPQEFVSSTSVHALRAAFTTGMLDSTAM